MRDRCKKKLGLKKPTSKPPIQEGGAAKSSHAQTPYCETSAEGRLIAFSRTYDHDKFQPRLNVPHRFEDPFHASPLSSKASLDDVCRLCLVGGIRLEFGWGNKQSFLEVHLETFSVPPNRKVNFVMFVSWFFGGQITDVKGSYRFFFFFWRD